ncbi:hypothetical protein HDU76_005673 [Blyttiomyces sp. JEL0837]|nr:hypothetical protein HDU76_005673 [Blyttiomyces sp. JEL0837]
MQAGSWTIGSSVELTEAAKVKTSRSQLLACSSNNRDWVFYSDGFDIHRIRVNASGIDESSKELVIKDVGLPLSLSIHNEFLAVSISGEIQVFRYDNGSYIRACLFTRPSATWTTLAWQLQGTDSLLVVCAVWTLKISDWKDGQPKIREFEWTNSSFPRSLLSLSDYTFAATLDMPENDIFSSFDVMSLRGWKDDQSLLFNQAHEPSNPPTPFALPLAQRTQKTAESSVVTFKLMDGERRVEFTSKCSMPILMPDIVLFEEATRTLFAANNSVSVLLSWSVRDDFTLKLEPNVTRLDTNTVIVGAASTPRLPGSVILLLARGTRTSDTSVLGFKLKSVAERSLQLCTVSSSKVSKAVENMVEKLDIVSVPKAEPSEAGFMLRLPNEVNPTAAFKIEMLTEIGHNVSKSESSSAIHNSQVLEDLVRRVDRLDSQLSQFIESSNARLSRLLEGQEAIMSILKSIKKD